MVKLNRSHSLTVISQQKMSVFSQLIFTGIVTFLVAECRKIPTEKAGKCPPNKPFFNTSICDPALCRDVCSFDISCSEFEEDEKCCLVGCCMKCIFTTPQRPHRPHFPKYKEKKGKCPPRNFTFKKKKCHQNIVCRDDDDCPGKKKCCPGGPCDPTCVKPRFNETGHHHVVGHTERTTLSPSTEITTTLRPYDHLESENIVERTSTVAYPDKYSTSRPGGCPAVVPYLGKKCWPNFKCVTDNDCGKKQKCCPGGPCELMCMKSEA